MKLLRELWDVEGDGRLPRSRTGVIAFILTTLGILLGATVDMGFLLLCGAGIFGPNLMREFGWLKDRDELQQEAARRAAFRAYLIGGMFTLVVVVSKQWGTSNLDHNDAPAFIILLTFVIPYMYSYLTSFWGIAKAVQRILLAFGLFWLVFNILGNLTDPLAMLMQCLIAVPYFALALLSRKAPRVTGALLIAFGLFSLFAFDMIESLAKEGMIALAVILLLWLPLVYSGVALLRMKRDSGEA